MDAASFVLVGMVDRFGRKWPLIIVLLVIATLQLGTGFVNTFPQFLACRSLFGIAMGGVWGLASVTSMENMPVEARGLYSGFMQVGYPGGYLIASVVNLFLVPESPQTWRTIYWVGCGISVFAAFIRFLLPESSVFQRAKEGNQLKTSFVNILMALLARENHVPSSEKTRRFMMQFVKMVKIHWQLWFYGVILMSGMNFLSHGSQDLYTTFMQVSKGFSADRATKANIVGECGAVLGAVLGGYTSQFLGRRLTLVVGCAIAVYLNELSPPAFRGLYPGTVYQLGNAASSAAAQIEATAGLHIRKQVFGVNQPDYGKVQAIMAACSAGLILLAVMFGPENHSIHFEDAGIAIEAFPENEVHQTDEISVGEKDEKYHVEYGSEV
ncbi:hypothetical protein Clacol_009033 [Clathrus columnatus]|uniref:Major facilitator superfamily (MFS) profile domain-containing protein n=1 Tax=Clathrus columnatus TaxID=1419009 RepID=A0AAV5APK9_9AGAM|nr:hypothetical protein Clacol_009033 [Clathrus columnatus]